MASKAWGNYKRRVKIKRRSEYLVKEEQKKLAQEKQEEEAMEQAV